ncbi:MAG: CRISPR-associated protein Csn1 [Bacteroidales bacterium]|nr:CRISPR-associated protein Csn1 [Bacteroidales bacterium]
MKKILGLDLGTNSIGWAIVNKDGNEYSLGKNGVRIFSEGVKNEKGIESSKAAERTNYRSARKIKFRRKLRKYETLLVLAKNKMCPLTPDEVIEWRKSGFKNYPLKREFIDWLRTDEKRNINPYYLRNKASKQKVTLYELGRALYHIAQRRGFLSNRLDQSADGIIEQHAPNIENLINESENLTDLLLEIDHYFMNLDVLEKKTKDLDDGEKKLKTLYNSIIKKINSNSSDLNAAKTSVIERLYNPGDLGEVKKGIHDLSQEIKEVEFTTLGQYFYSKYNKNKIRNHYTAREEHYLTEFEIICKKQELHSINEREKLPEKRYSGLVMDLYKAIFFQRPLKSQKGLVGKCSFEKNKSRCSVSHPDFEEYRMWTYLNTIKIKTPADPELRFLTLEEKQKLIPKFFKKSKESFNFEELALALIPKGALFEFYKSRRANKAFYLFNYKANDTVSGCPVSASFKNIFGDEWMTRKFAYETKNKKGETIVHKIGYKDLWHLLYVSTTNTYLEEFAISKLGMDEKRAKSFSRIRLKKDFANLSLNAINKISPYLKKGLLYSHAVFMANIEKVVDAAIWQQPAERIKIQDGIANIIENNILENALLEAANGLIKDCKANNDYYSKEAEGFLKKDLQKRLDYIFKSKGIKEGKEKISDDLFTVFIEHFKKNSFIPIKRLDGKVFEFLKGNNNTGEVYCNEEGRLKKLYHPSDIEVFKKKIIKDQWGNEKPALGSPLTSSIKNPMAMRALHQLRKVLNALIMEGEIDPGTEIHIELARELNDANKRKAIKDYQNENKDKRDKYREEIKKLYYAACNKEIEPTEDDLLRYQLWEEQNRMEIYEEGKNISICDIIGSNPKYDIEHTIPRSLSQDNSLMNKTLCSQRFNRDVKKQKLPIELSNHADILNRVDHWRKESEELTEQIIRITKSIKATTTKEAKDKKIRYRHYLTFKRDYLQGKYERFVWEEPKKGFKNSQLPDTGIITKYAQAYLKSYFNRVVSVKGGMVAEFRKIWGLHPGFMENGFKYYMPKDRSKHTHHTIDAITMACMTKEKYDVLAHAWTLEDDPKKENYSLIKELFEKSKPWPTFTQDMKQLEEEILVSHHTPDNVKKQSKKILRVRGKKQYVAEVLKDDNGKAIPKKDEEGKIIYKLDENGNKIPRYQQGDTIRGSLHQESFYGAIKNPKNQEEIQYVIRKDLESLKKTDIESIVDDGVREKIEKAIQDGILVISSNQQQKNKLKGKIWMNEEKMIPINKVRIIATTVKNPLSIKKHVELSKSKKEHKQIIYAQNDENFAIAIYEGINKKGKIKRSFTIINNKDAGSYFKKSHKNNEEINDIVEHNHCTTGVPLKYILKKGIMVIFYEENPTEILDLKVNEIQKRLYKLSKFDSQGRLTFRPSLEARPASELKEVYRFDFENPAEQVRLQVSKLNLLVEGYDFIHTETGNIKYLSK